MSFGKTVEKRGNESRDDLDFIVNSLLAISSQEYQVKAWYRAEGREAEDYEERTLNFEADVDYLKDLLREKKIWLDPRQIRAILRVNVMSRHFNQLLSRETLPQEHGQLQFHIINHPYWLKIGRQATYALSLLKIDVAARNLVSAPDLSTEGRFRKLDHRIQDAMTVFGNRDVRGLRWKNADDFWTSVIDYNKLARKFFAGLGSLSSGQRLRAFMTFHRALDEFCGFYEDDSMVTLKQILSDPRFREVEQKAQEFLKIGSERRT